jgi:hypothetical protein
MPAVKVMVLSAIFFSSSRIFSFGISCQKGVANSWLDSRQIPGRIGFSHPSFPDLFWPPPFDILIGEPRGTFNRFV